MNNSSPDRSDALSGSYEHDFQTPQRRQKILLRLAIGVFAIIAVLVWLMARGPDSGALAGRIVEEASSRLPEGTISVEQLEAAAGEFHRALEISPDSQIALQADERLKQRTAGQIGDHIAQGELPLAEELFAQAGEIWADESDFAESGTLWRGLERLREEQQIAEEVQHLIADAREALASGEMDGEDLVLIREALDQLRRALDQLPGNSQIQSMRETVRQDLVTATRQQLDAGATGQAEQLLDLAGNEWGNDAAIDQLRQELDTRLGDLAREAEVQRLIGLGFQRLAENSLTTPAGNSAVDWFRQALFLEDNNEQAKDGLAQVADQYVVLITDATDEGEYIQARDLLARLTGLEPDHGSIDDLREGIEEGEAAERLAVAERKSAAPPPVVAEPESATSPDTSPVITGDEEGRLWSTVRELCDESQLRRYIEAYPSGRYIEEAWRRRSECLEAANTGRPQ